MLRELKDNDVDNIMNLWKNEIVQSSRLQKKEVIANEYTKVRDQIINNIKSTIIYTEDGEIQGFITINKNQEIFYIVVKSNIRREGIGTILLENAKSKYKKLTVKIDKNNEYILKFFYKNNFVKTEETQEDANEAIYTLVWNKEEKKKINLIYFDDDIDKNAINNSSNINFKCVSVKQFFRKEKIETTEINNIKTYMKIRKKLEELLIGEKILLYINYNNHYKFLDEQIKEIVKIKKIDLSVIICEPFSIEGSKKIDYIKQIEEVYKDYKIHKLDCSIDINQNINLNQIFQKRNEIILQKIERIAQNV